MLRSGNTIQRIIRSDDSFKELVGKLDKAECKRIYDRCYTRLTKRGLSKDRIKTFINDEIRSELFKLLPKKETEVTTDAQRREREEFEKPTEEYRQPIHGVRLWGNEKTESDDIQELEENYKQIVKEGFVQAFCPRCMSHPCICRSKDY